MAVIFIFALTPAVKAQEEPLRINTIEADTLADSIRLKDSLLTVKDTLLNDSLRNTDSTDSTKHMSLEERLGIKISPDAITSEIKSEASDSAVLDMRNNIFILYGKAKVTNEDMELNAGKIIYDQGNNLVTAAPLSDTAIKLKDRPNFSQGQEKFTYDSLQYNFKSKRAIVRNPRTQYGEGYVYSEQVKRNPDQSIYGYRNLYTTCALDTPHFGIKAQKIKVIPGRVVASGPANIMVEQVPTPLFLPFGLFPVTKGQRSGFLLPTYSIDNDRGVGLLNGGYYFNLGQHLDLESRVNIYSKGSWLTTGRANYAKRYKYKGGLAISYAYNKTGEDFEPDASISKDFNVQWQHATDPKARPGTQFSASVNAGTSSFNANNTYDAQQILNNQYQSNITYSKNWANKPYTLSVGARHSQTASTGSVSVTLPEISFYVAQFNPFQPKNSLGTKWYEKITTSYTFTGQNQLMFTDSLFQLSKLSMSDFNNAMKHTIPISASYNLFRFVNLTVGGTYNEYWLTKQTFKSYDYTGDTVAEDINRGFYTARDFNASIAANTRIYGLKMFKRGKLMGIRHMMTPEVSLNYTPDFAKSPYHFGYETITEKNGRPTYVSPYEGSLQGAPSQLGRFRSVIGFKLNNNLQIKVRSNSDTNGYKNIRLIDNFIINTGYDIAADSQNWQDIQVSFSTMFFNIINVNANASYDPYAFDYETGKKTNQTMWNRGTGIARFKQANISMGAQLKPQKRQDNNPKRNTEEYQLLTQYGIDDVYYDFNVPWNMGLSYTLGIAKNYLPTSKKDTVQISTHNVSINGDVNLTSRWKITASTSYNFVQKKLQLSQINLVRDLHCWEMILTAVPFGDRKFYNFTLHVKATVLQDLKLLRRRVY
ncbi:MAG: LPS-assembly protein LptD [Chitinophagales bacterium]|nr:LPS-assembly protein LptD [Chitinophagales bacterium]